MSPLHLAAEAGDLPAIASALRAGHSASGVDQLGRTPLDLAAWKGHAEAVEFLLAAAPPAAVRMTGALCAAAAAGHLRVVELLLAAAPDAAAGLDECDVTPLHWAAQSKKEGGPEIVKLLLAAAPRLALATTGGGRVPLHWAALGNADVVELLLAAAPETALVADSDGRTPLHTAVAFRNYRGAKLLLAAAPEAASAADHQGRVPLHCAGHFPTAELLLAAAPEAALVTDVYGCTPLHTSIANAPPRTTELLVAAAPSAAAMADEDGTTPLHLAARYCEAVVPALLAAAPQATLARNRVGNTPLHVAAGMGTVGAVRALLAAAPEAALARNRAGLAPLHCARTGEKLQVLMRASPGAPGAPVAAFEEANRRGAGLDFAELAPLSREQWRALRDRPVEGGPDAFFDFVGDEDEDGYCEGKDDPPSLYETPLAILHAVLARSSLEAAELMRRATPGERLVVQEVLRLADRLRLPPPQIRELVRRVFM